LPNRKKKRRGKNPMDQIKRVVHIEDVPFRENADTTGNPNDQGRWKSLIDKEKGSQDLSLGIGWLRPGEIHLLHHHEEASEFYYILDGTGTITVADEVVKVRPGTSIYIKAGDPHKIVNDGKKEMIVLFGYNKLEWPSIWDE